MMKERTTRRRATVAARITACLLFFGFSSCDFLSNTGGMTSMVLPIVRLFENQAVLVQSPNLNALTRYYCDDVLPFPADQACHLLGAPPAKEQLQFRFQLPFEVQNPNRLPIPTTELLVGLHVYPGQTFGELGGVCTPFCESGAADCPIPPAGACVHQATDIDSLDSFLAAVVNGALTLATEALNGQPVGSALSAFTIPAEGSLELKPTLVIGVDPMLELLGYTAEEYVQQVINTGSSRLDIPYSVAARFWFNVPYLGRVTVGAGPFGTEEEPLIWPVL